MFIKDRIVAALKKSGDLSVKELVDSLDVSRQAIHVAINQLLEANVVVKFGKTPKTIYRLQKEIVSVEDDHFKINSETEKFLSEHFLVITELGKILEGAEAFSLWCKQRNLPFVKTADEYVKTKNKYDRYFNDKGLIDGKEKLSNTKGFHKINLDDIYYLDFYAIERFDKTRMGTLLHYAKQGQNKFLMKKMVSEIKPKTAALANSGLFDAVGYVPPTIRLEVQIMKYLETHLKINLPKIKIQKISGIIPVPQKSLSKIEERINNVEHTFSVNETIKYNHLLLVDDAVGSGSTMNQIAGKIKQKGVAKKVTGLAVVGSFKGFDVITDV